MENLQERIQKKEQQIQKLERLYLRYATDTEEKSIIDRFLETGDRTEYRAWLKANNCNYGGDAWSKANELYDARNTLAKYQKMSEAETDRKNTLNELPEALIKFHSYCIRMWDEYDLNKQSKMNAESEPDDWDEWHKWCRYMSETYGTNWREFRRLTKEEIHKANVKDADTLVLNLIDRVVERVGQITDCRGLRLDSDNRGFTIINGRIIGTKGTVRIESIGAGGYNIQRYHIRVLVK